jgi:hypothetical protein
MNTQRHDKSVATYCFALKKNNHTGTHDHAADFDYIAVDETELISLVKSLMLLQAEVQKSTAKRNTPLHSIRQILNECSEIVLSESIAYSKADATGKTLYSGNWMVPKSKLIYSFKTRTLRLEETLERLGQSILVYLATFDDSDAYEILGEYIPQVPQSRTTIVVNGGVVQDVFCSDPDCNITIIDVDNLKEMEEMDPKTIDETISSSSDGLHHLY